MGNYHYDPKVVEAHREENARRWHESHYTAQASVAAREAFLEGMKATPFGARMAKILGAFEAALAAGQDPLPRQ